MAVDMFLKIDGVEGESQDAKNKGEIHIESFQFGVEQVGTSDSGGGLGAGKAKFEDFEFTMPTQKASPKLYGACATGKHIKSAVLTVRKAGGSQDWFLKHTFSDLLVSSFRTANGEPQPQDTVKLNFVKLETEYREQKSDGTFSGAVKAGYDLKANKAT